MALATVVDTVEGLLYTLSTRVSVPSSELDPLPPPPPASVSVSPLDLKEWGSNTRLRMRVGDPVSTAGQKAWYSVYSVVDTIGGHSETA